MAVLISGASVAGPILAYWLERFGFEPVVVELAPSLRTGLGGHAVDLFGPAVDIVEWMGALPELREASTGTKVMELIRPGKRTIEVDLGKITAGISDRHIEILRGELARILYERTSSSVEYIFGDSITSLEEDSSGVTVAFAGGSTRRFDLVIGADGLHSNVRRLVFGPEKAFTHFLGGYLGVFSVPNYLGLEGKLLAYNVIDKLAAIYPVHQTGEVRAGLFLRSGRELDYDYRDTEQQMQLLRTAFAGEGWEIPRLLEEIDNAPDFYFDSISQIRMPSWSRGRVTLVGDAGYSPGPAVGGGTSLAAVGAFLLAGELAANPDHEKALPAYEDKLRDLVLRFRQIGPNTMKTIIPASALQLAITAQMFRLFPRLPVGLQRRLAAFQGGPARAFDNVRLTKPEA